MAEDFAQGLIGVTLDGRYRLDALLGEGGMGCVFRATHLAMERRVAVKLLKPHLTGDPAQLQRFAREARSTHKVDSPHAVKLLDFGVTPERDYYLVLEYLDGRTVQRELEVDGPFAPARVVRIARQALDALAAAHRSGVVHRDIKPDNLLVMRVGADADFTKVLDFGVAKLMEGTAISERSRLALTQAGRVFGTPEFMSPEQACGHVLDGRSDLYSLAVTMFVMLTGQPMFAAGSALAWLTHHVRTPAPRLADVGPELAGTEQLDAVLQRCLAKQRDDRPRTAEELASLLDAVAATLPTLPRAGTSTGRPRQASASSYVEPLASETLLPAASPQEPGADREPVHEEVEPAGLLQPARAGTSTTTGVMRELQGRRRSVLVVTSAVAVTAVIVTMIGVATTGTSGSASRSTSPPATGTGTQLAGPVAPSSSPRDAAVLLAPLPPADASSAAVVDAGARPVAVRRSPADVHVRQAEEAHRAGNLLRQLSEADLALRVDPRHARAKFLLGDALIRSGDLARGCSYLRAVGRKHSACATD